MNEESKIGVSTHIRNSGALANADLDTLFITLYVELGDRIIPIHETSR
jgi:hypothetical protein